MMERLESWKLALERLRSVDGSDWAEAAGAVATVNRNVQATAVEALTTR